MEIYATCTSRTRGSFKPSSDQWLQRANQWNFLKALTLETLPAQKNKHGAPLNQPIEFEKNYEAMSGFIIIFGSVHSLHPHVWCLMFEPSFLGGSVWAPHPPHKFCESRNPSATSTKRAYTLEIWPIDTQTKVSKYRIPTTFFFEKDRSHKIRSYQPAPLRCFFVGIGNETGVMNDTNPNFNALFSGNPSKLPLHGSIKFDSTPFWVPFFMIPVNPC